METQLELRLLNPQQPELPLDDPIDHPTTETAPPDTSYQAKICIGNCKICKWCDGN